MDDSIDISDLDEAAVLAALYNRSAPKGLGFVHYQASAMTIEQAAELLTDCRDFDYLQGRVMKITFFDAERPESEYNMPGHLRGEWLYDRDNGKGAVRDVLEQLRAARAAE